MSKTAHPRKRTVAIFMSPETRKKLEAIAAFPPGESPAQALARIVARTPICTYCHDKGTVNYEGAAGWDEPCPKCQGDK